MIQEVKIGMAELQSRQLKSVGCCCSPSETTGSIPVWIQLFVS